MSTPPAKSASGSALQSIVVGVAIALIAGGTSPWWWNKLFPEPPASAAPASGGGEGTTPRPFMGPLEGGTNRNGGDLATVGIQGNSAPECSDMCAADDNCRAMTFVKHPDANGGICWLKGSVPSPNPDQSKVSAVKIYPKP